MPVLLLPLAIAALSAGLLRQQGWRDAFLRGSVSFGAILVLLTEGMGAIGLLRPAIVAGCWLAVVAAGAYMSWRNPFLRAPWRWPARGLVLDGVLLAGIGVVLAVAGLTATLSPPNSVDAMGYHMARVVYWLQARSVAFFPVHYYQQIMLGPQAEYTILHTWLLSGADHFANFAQWFGFAGSTIGVSAIAREFGLTRRGQIMSALFCATLPNGILQASGAKNECVLALWMTAAVYFGWRWREGCGRDLLPFGAAVGLALFTKGTAYVFLPGVVAGIFAPVAWRMRKRLLVGLGVVAWCAAAINAPLWVRNVGLSGSPLGFSTGIGPASEHPQLSYRNARIGVKPALSNLMRNLSAHLGARSDRWNQAVYRAVLFGHHALGMDPNDPDTTWLWTRFEPPSNSNHEADAPNRWQLLLLVVAAIPLFGRRTLRSVAWYQMGILLAFILFCIAVRWQPWVTRMHLPLFVLSAPVAGLMLESLRPAVLPAVMCLFLLNNSRPALFQNWVRPLRGEHSLWRTSRQENYFADMQPYNTDRQYQRTVERIRQSGCTDLGIDNNVVHLEYPILALLLEASPRFRFEHVGVTNASAQFPRRPDFRPCAVVCIGCDDHPERTTLYRGFGDPIPIGRFRVFLRSKN